MSVKENEIYVSPEEYLAGETYPNAHHEYHDGMIAALPGASPEHIAITTNVAGDLRMQLRGRPYRVFANHLRIKSEAACFYTYPDIVVICDHPIMALEGEQPNTVVNPILIVEVTSDATELADRTAKLDCYQQIPNLREYVLIGHREPTVVSYLRPTEGNEWIRTEVNAEKALLYLASIDCSLTVADVYATPAEETDEADESSAE